MEIRVQRHANVSKQATLLDGLDVSPLKWRVCGCGLNRSVHEGMNDISNGKVYLSYDVASGSEITPCNKIDKPLFLHGNSLRETV